MAFAMLRNLGESKFSVLQSELARGKAPLAPARTIRSEWEIFRIAQTLCWPCSFQRFSVSKKEVEHANQGQVPSDRYGPREV
jgi:hypothetical protein